MTTTLNQHQKALTYLQELGYVDATSEDVGHWTRDVAILLPEGGLGARMIFSKALLTEVDGVMWVRWGVMPPRIMAVPEDATVLIRT